MRYTNPRTQSLRAWFPGLAISNESVPIQLQARMQDMKFEWCFWFKKKWEMGKFFLFLKSGNGGVFVKKWTFPRRRVHYVWAGHFQR